MSTISKATVKWEEIAIFSPEPRMYVVDVTVEAAVKWLEGNTHNRPIRDGRVSQYAGDIKAGHWRFTHQGICFDRNGTLIDGQHRLYAVLEANRPARMAVWVGMDPATHAFIDEGLSRSVVDVLRLSGNGNISPYKAAAARRMVIGVRTFVTLSRQDQIDFIKEHDKALTFVIEEVFQKRKVQRVMPAPVGAVMARAFYHEDHDRLIEFGAIILDGITSSQKDVAAVLLRSWLLAGTPTDRSVSVAREALIYMKAQRALVAFIAGEQMRNLYPMRDEYWALPGEARKTRTQYTGVKIARPKRS